MLRNASQKDKQLRIRHISAAYVYERYATKLFDEASISVVENKNDRKNQTDGKRGRKKHIQEISAILQWKNENFQRSHEQPSQVLLNSEIKWMKAIDEAGMTGD